MCSSPYATNHEEIISSLKREMRCLVDEELLDIWTRTQGMELLLGIRRAEVPGMDSVEVTVLNELCRRAQRRPLDINTVFTPFLNPSDSIVIQL